MTTMLVKVNTEDPEAYEVALEKGAAALGLFRTEHAFTGPEAMTELRSALFLRENFGPVEERFRNTIMNMAKAHGNRAWARGYIRTLDPPMHEFIPQTEAAWKMWSDYSKRDREELEYICKPYLEPNPMMGVRGQRLIGHPLIQSLGAITMHTHAPGIEHYPFRIMYPMVENPMVRIANHYYAVMLEVPAAIINILESTESLPSVLCGFSFGTNDLTQFVHATSRDSSYNSGLFTKLSGPVKALMRDGVRKLRSLNRYLEIGLCGEHAVTYENIVFAKSIGLNYISVSPPNVDFALKVVKELE